jgi:uncharacterized protein with HEPN domain
MLSKRAHLALIDIRDCILQARGFIECLSYDAFKQSRLHVFAVTRALEIVSEASRRLPDSLREKHSTLPWRAIRDAGNVYRHSYDNVVEAIIWQTLQEDLEPLLAVVIAEIAEIEARSAPCNG